MMMMKTLFCHQLGFRIYEAQDPRPITPGTSSLIQVTELGDNKVLLGLVRLRANPSGLKGFEGDLNLL